MERGTCRSNAHARARGSSAAARASPRTGRRSPPAGIRRAGWSAIARWLKDRRFSSAEKVSFSRSVMSFCVSSVLFFVTERVAVSATHCEYAANRFLRSISFVMPVTSFASVVRASSSPRSRSSVAESVAAVGSCAALSRKVEARLLTAVSTVPSRSPAGKAVPFETATRTRVRTLSAEASSAAICGARSGSSSATSSIVVAKSPPARFASPIGCSAVANAVSALRTSV